MKLIPENKTFLYIVLVIIALLIGFQVVRMIPRNTSMVTSPAFLDVQRLVSHEMSVRKRHAELLKSSKAWDRLYLTGTPREASLNLLNKVQQWTASSGLSYDMVQILEEQSSSKKNQVGISIRGNGSYKSVLGFLNQVENADFMVSVTSLRLKKEFSSEGLRYELIVCSPLSRKRG